MSVAKVTEISSSSTVSFEDAVKQGVDRACQTLDQVKGAWISEQQVVVEVVGANPSDPRVFRRCSRGRPPGWPRAARDPKPWESGR